MWTMFRQIVPSTEFTESALCFGFFDKGLESPTAWKVRLIFNSSSVELQSSVLATASNLVSEQFQLPGLECFAQECLYGQLKKTVQTPVQTEVYFRNEYYVAQNNAFNRLSTTPTANQLHVFGNKYL